MFRKDDKVIWTGTKNDLNYPGVLVKKDQDKNRNVIWVVRLEDDAVINAYEDELKQDRKTMQEIKSARVARLVRGA